MSGNQDLLWEHGEKISIGFKCKYYRVEKVEEGQPMPHKIMVNPCHNGGRQATDVDLILGKVIAPAQWVQPSAIHVHPPTHIHTHNHAHIRTHSHIHTHHHIQATSFNYRYILAWALVVRLVNYRYVCIYITISSLCVPLLFEFISIFRNIIMDITHTSKKRPKND